MTTSMGVTWSGRIVPSTGEEFGLDEVAPNVFAYVTRDPQDPSFNHTTPPLPPPAGEHPSPTRGNP